MFNKENLLTLKETFEESIYLLKSEVNKIEKKSVNEYLLPTIDILESCNLKLQEMQTKIEYPGDDDEIPF